MKLRPYQSEAVAATYAALRERDDNPCVVIPTAAGKTHVIATICHDTVVRWDGRVLILAHVRELLEQAVEKIALHAPDLPVGVYSAGMKRRDTDYGVTAAGIQSVHKRAAELGAFDLIIVDEAHMIPPDGEGRYREFLADAKTVNPDVRIIGLTATAFRMKTGTICAPNNVLNHICYEIGVKTLVGQGYICKLHTKAGIKKPNTDKLHVRAGEYIPAEVEKLMNDDELVWSACREIFECTADRRSVLIFASGVKHGEHVAEVFQTRHGVECGFVCGESLPYDRDETLRRFRTGELKYLANVNVLTHGFNATSIDCVALLRPTLSPGLFYQMVGRGFRLHPGKTDCLILDFAGNTMRHGPVDALSVEPKSNGDDKPVVKECPECHAIIAAGYGKCPDCGHEFPAPRRQEHDATASDEGILSSETTRTEHEVADVFYILHVKRGAAPDAPRSMRVDYDIGYLGQRVSEWVCIEHDGYARQKAAGWWYAHSRAPMPDNVEDAVALAEQGALATPTKITVERKAGDQFDRIVEYELGDKPAREDLSASRAPVSFDAACPDCGCYERTLRPGDDSHAAQEICTRCGRWLCWVPKQEAEARWAAETPF